MLACRGNCLRAHFWSREPKNKAKLNRLIGQVFYRGVGEGSRKTRKTPLRGFALRLVLVIRPLLRIDLLPMVGYFQTIGIDYMLSIKCQMHEMQITRS
jgi:hypothetical protein